MGFTIVASSVCSTVRHWSGCHDGRSSIVRRTPATIPASGSSSSTGASDPFATSAPESHSERKAYEPSTCCGQKRSVQFSHAPSDRDLAERFWPQQIDGSYAFRSLWDSGALVANGSDAPVEELDPLAGIRAGVLRTIDDRPAWRPDEALTVEQALHASTVAPAWLTGDERRRGKLLPGYLSDLVVLDRDPVAIPVDELTDVQVVATMVGGRWVHGAPPWD